MAASVADIANRFRFNERLLSIETDGFAPTDWGAVAGPKGGNCAHWIVGHVAKSRRDIRRLLGDAVPSAPWEGLYARGGAPGAALSPAPADLVADVAASGEAIAARLASASEADLDRDVGFAVPDGGRTARAALSFLYFHETYHLGQVGLLRRIHGHAGFA